ncbi:hypothetical protein RI543_004081, partial [Arxiozyma heterogenica]
MVEIIPENLPSLATILRNVFDCNLSSYSILTLLIECLLTRSDIIITPWKSSNQIQYLIQATARMAVSILHPDAQVLPSEL